MQGSLEPYFTASIRGSRLDRVRGHTMDEPIWFYVQSGRRTGPVTTTQLIALLDGGSVPMDGLVWAEGHSDWRPARDIPELIKRLPPPLPEPAPAPIDISATRPSPDSEEGASVAFHRVFNRVAIVIICLGLMVKGFEEITRLTRNVGDGMPISQALFMFGSMIVLLTLPTVAASALLLGGAIAGLYVALRSLEQMLFGRPKE